MKQAECFKKEQEMTVWSVVIQVMIILFLSALFVALIQNKILSLIFGLVTWCVLFFKTPMSGWFFLVVKPNWAVVLRKQTSGDRVFRSTDPKLQQDSSNWREVGPGIRGKSWKEVVVTSIDLQREIIVGTKDGKPLECYTSEGTRLFITYQVVITALRGFLTNLARQSEEAVIAQVRGKFEQAIINWVHGKKEDDVFNALTDLKDKFNRVYGGGNVISSEEEELGVFTNDPQILSVSRSSDYARAAEGEKISQTVARSVESLLQTFVTMNGGKTPQNLDPNLIAVLAAASAGQKTEGVLIIPGIGGDAAALMAAAAKLKKP